MSTAVVPSLSCDPSKLEKYVKFTSSNTSSSLSSSSNQTVVTDLPDDVLLIILLMLPPKDLIRYYLDNISVSIIKNF